jgi:8-oxo-dGTP pyrophosphatase MutT (NUDIX family)
MVEAAGGVVWRITAKGLLKVAVVHRPKHDDWSFPKGKLDDGEDHPTAARREVEEETGLRCKLVQELPETRYQDRYGRPKRVRYWSMEVLSGDFAPNDEVDELVWLPVDEARAKLSYEHDRRVLDALAVPAGARP